MCIRDRETVIAENIHTYAGGKGGNQAVATAKLGHAVMMVGMLGEDDNGRFYRETLRKNGVDAECVGSDANTPSGTAIIEVDDRGENRIAIIPGTNGLVDNAYMDSMLERMLTCDIFLMQYEIDLNTVAHLAKILRREGKCLILDPAPAANAPEELYKNVDYICLLYTSARQMYASGILLGSIDIKKAVIDELRSANIPTVGLNAYQEYPFDTVHVHGSEGSYLAVRHLIALGHRHIGFAGGTPHSMIANSQMCIRDS